jgi:26S proteasome regulatory subunit N1
VWGQVAATLDARISKFCSVTLETCAYAGTGDVLKVQGMLALCGEHISTDDNSTWKVKASVMVLVIISKAISNHY